MPTQWWQFAPSDRLHVSSLHDTPSLHIRNNERTRTRRNYSASHTHHTSGGASGGSSLVHFTQPQTSASSSSATGITATPSFTRSRTYHSHIAHTPLGENYHVKTSLPLNPHDGLVYMEVQIVGIADHTLSALQQKICKNDNNVVVLADEAKSILEPSLVIGICRELLPSHSLPGQDATSVGLYTKQKMIFSNSHKTTERVALPLCSIPPLLLESSLHQETHSEENKISKNMNKQEIDAKEAMSSDYQITRGNSSPTNGLGAIRSCSLHNQQRAMASNSENRFHQSVHWAESTHANSIANNNNNNNNKKSRRVSNVHGITRRKLTIGDVIGCLINFFDNTLHFTLNGELLEYSRKLDEKIPLNGYYMAIGMQAGCPSMTFQVIFRTGNRSLCNVNQSLFHLHPLPSVECLRARSDTVKLTNEQKEIRNSSISPSHLAKQQQQKCEEEHYNKYNMREYENKCNENKNGANADIVFDLNSYINAVAMKMIRHSAQLQEEQKISVQLKEHKEMLAKLEEATFKRDNKEGTYIEPSARNTRDYLIWPDENQTQETVSPYDTNDVFNYKSNSSEFKMNLKFLEGKQEEVEELESYVEDKSVNDRAMVSLLAQFMSMRGMTHTLNVLQQEVNELHYGQANQATNSKETPTSVASQIKEEKEIEQRMSYRVTKCQEVQNKEVVKNIALECALCHSQTIAQARRVLFEQINEYVMNAEHNTFLSMWQSHSIVSPVVWQSVLHLLFPFDSRLCLCNCQKTKDEVEKEECYKEKENNKKYVLLNEGHVMQRIAHLSSLFFLVRRQDVLFMLQSLYLIEFCCASLLRYISSIHEHYSAKRNGTNITSSSESMSDFMPSNNNVNVLHCFAMNVLQPFRALSAAKEMLNAEQEMEVIPRFSHDHMLREMCQIVESMCLPHNECSEKGDHEINKAKSNKLLCAKSTTSSYSTRTLSHVMQTLNVNEAQEQFIVIMQQMKDLRSNAIEHIKQYEHAVRATHVEQTRVAVQDQLQIVKINNTNKSGVQDKQNAKATIAPSFQSSSNAQSKFVSSATNTKTSAKHNINVPHTPQAKEKYKLSQQWQNEEEEYKKSQQEILDQAVAMVMAECIPIIDSPSLPEQIYIAQTLNTFCMRVRSFFDCLQVSAHNSASASSVQDKESNTVVVITEWCERWITLIQTALVQYRERVWSMLHKAIEEANESACQNIFYCILHKLQMENRKLSLYSLFENFTDSDDFYVKNFTNANGVLNEDINNNNYYYSHVINIFDNYISKDTSRKHREVELLREFSRALMQLTKGSSLRSIWRTCHVKSILESAPQMPSNAFLNEMSAILHDLPPFYITQSFMTGKEEEKEHDYTEDKMKTVDNSISYSNTIKNVQLSASRSPLKRPATPPTCEEQHTKAQRHLLHLHTRNKVTCGAHQEQHWSKNSPNEHRLQFRSSSINKSNTTVQSTVGRGNSENISDVNTINENNCTSNTAVPARPIDIDSQDVLEEEWHMDEFSLGVVYLHRIYKRLFH